MCALLNPGAGDVESSSKADNRRASLARTCFMIYIGFLWMQTIHVWYWLRRGWVNPRVTFDGKVRDLEPPRDKWCGPESDSPPACVSSVYVWASRCNSVGFQPIQKRLRLGCITALPR